MRPRKVTSFFEISQVQGGVWVVHGVDQFPGLVLVATEYEENILPISHVVNFLRITGEDIFSFIFEEGYVAYFRTAFATHCYANFLSVEPPIEFKYIVI